MSGYQVRRARYDDDVYYRFQRWIIHSAGYPYSVRGYALTKRSAMRTARRWTREAAKPIRSYDA